MKKMRIEREVNNGWSRWVQPVMRNYLMACCDCGLVHRVSFRIIKITKKLAGGVIRGVRVGGHQVQFKAQRASNYTKRQRKGIPK